MTLIKGVLLLTHTLFKNRARKKDFSPKKICAHQACVLLTAHRGHAAFISTFRTRLAKLRVHIVSPMLSAVGRQCTSIKVLLSPPNDSSSKEVSFEFRYGTCACLAPRAAMTSASALSDLLMCCASFRACPSASDFESRSDPARSTRVSCECRRLAYATSQVVSKQETTPFACFLKNGAKFCSLTSWSLVAGRVTTTLTTNKLCERLDTSFIEVFAVERC